MNLLLKRFILLALFLVIALAFISCGDFETELMRAIDDISKHGEEATGSTFGEPFPLGEYGDLPQPLEENFGR